MNDAVRDRDVLLVVGGGIAAYKSVMVARELVKRGARVETVLTRAAERFVSGVTFAGITGRPAHTKLWDPAFAGERHIALSSRAAVAAVVPATANLLARMAHGLANDLATTCLLATAAPVVVAPAMHTRMWQHPATQANVALLAARGVRFEGPVAGALASGEEGLGRMSEPEFIADAIALALTPQDLAGTRVVVSAGGTHEAIDPVRFLGNRSSGRMGYALAERAAARGASVVLVSGPAAVPAPAGVEVVRVRSAREMADAVLAHAASADAVIMAAAVADYRPSEPAREKLKKTSDELVLRLVKNPDILAELGARRVGVRPMLVGFAVETSDLLARAKEKLLRKRCDLVVANHADGAFEGDDNEVALVTADEVESLPRVSKRAVAERILDRVVKRPREG